jgi:hypothetical protein
MASSDRVDRVTPVDPVQAKSQEMTSQHQLHDEMSVTNEDDRDLLNLGYRAVLARGWGSFDNFACSFSALYCIGGIRVLFYIALSGGGPAAMYVSHPLCNPMLITDTSFM